MAVSALSDEIHRHLEAALALSKRDILLRLLHEAETCLQRKEVGAAAVLAGVLLEEASLLSEPRTLKQNEAVLNLWREIRNRAAHPSPREPEIDEQSVQQMLIGLRTLLDAVQSTPPPFHDEAALPKIRGKYAFVPTSVDDFLLRKQEDVDLEGRE